MKLNVKFKEINQRITPKFGEVFKVSDGGFERGYDAGYAKGETAGYNKGNSDGYANGYETGYAEATEIKYTSTGTAYVEIKSVTVPYVGLGGSHYVWCTDCNPQGAEVFNQYGVLEGYAPELVHCCGHYPFTNSGNPLLRKIVAPKLKKLEGGYWGRNLKGLEFLQLGSIGHAVELLRADSLGLRDTTDKLTIEVYVDAQTLADISPDVTSQAPWCATSATIIYRNSTTGEVITE